METTDLKITKEFWCIARYSSKNHSRIGLVECDTAKELDKFIEELSVTAGESMGEESFEVIALYQSWDVHNQNVGYEEEAEYPVQEHSMDTLPDFY